MFTQTESIDGKAVLTVGQLNLAARTRLEEVFSLVWVKGELSNVSLPRSGHIYFTLKDTHAQVRCAMFKGSNRHLNFTPQDGMAVLIRAQVSIYEERGDYQLIVTQMEEYGQGALQKAFEALKAKLQAEGLFEQSHKKALPAYPKHIGIVTSHTGAAIQDILSVLKRRYPIAQVTIYHTQVQGKTAAKEIVGAIELANAKMQADVLMIARGGGSLEDLWCFNEESVARAIYASKLPTVTGIGHEVDFTIADFVADLRAPTPSAAAETITPDQQELIALFENKKMRLIQAIKRKLDFAAQRLDSLEKQMIHPGMVIQQAFLLCEHLSKQLTLLMNTILEKSHNKLGLLSARLNAVSPLATLSRGYAIVTAENSQVIQDIHQVKVQQKVETQLHNGKFSSVVISIE
ncbi:MAG: exodeoxyribonuclease VII large subunit [Candidatus Berkiella sp.]